MKDMEWLLFDCFVPVSLVPHGRNLPVIVFFGG